MENELWKDKGGIRSLNLSCWEDFSEEGTVESWMIVTNPVERHIVSFVPQFKGAKSDSPLEPPGVRPRRSLESAPVVLVTQFVCICYSCRRKPVQGAS